MGFADEWAEIRAEAVRRTEDSQMRLNGQIASGSGRRHKGLHITPSVLKERAGKADTVRGDFTKADDDAMKETGEVAAGLKGFASAAAFGVFEDRWKDQMKYVQGLLQYKVSAALRDAADELDGEDLHQGTRYPKGKDGKHREPQQSHVPGD